MTNKPKTLSSSAPAAPAPAAAPDLSTETLDDGRVLQVAAAAPTGDLPGETYTPPNDVIETDANGSAIQIAAKGVPIPIAQARALGLIKDAPAPAHETKTDS